MGTLILNLAQGTTIFSVYHYYPAIFCCKTLNNKAIGLICPLFLQVQSMQK